MHYETVTTCTVEKAGESKNFSVLLEKSPCSPPKKNCTAGRQAEGGGGQHPSSPPPHFLVERILGCLDEATSKHEDLNLYHTEAGMFGLMTLPTVVLKRGGQPTGSFGEGTQPSLIANPGCVAQLSPES